MNAKAKDIQTTPEKTQLLITPLDLLATAVERGLDPDQLSKLMDLQDRHQANEARRAYAAALAQFQAECPVIDKSAQADRGKAGSYKYAPLDTILKTIRPALNNAGLSISFTQTSIKNGIVDVVCTVSHRDGHSEQSQFAAMVDPNMRANETQKIGSANSYAKRYALLNALNLATSEDDDGNAAGTPTITDRQTAGTPTITDRQQAEIAEWIESLEINEEKFLEFLDVDSIANIPAAKWPEVEIAIERKRAQS